jgi:hypothetical protein
MQHGGGTSTTQGINDNSHKNELDQQLPLSATIFTSGHPARARPWRRRRRPRKAGIKDGRKFKAVQTGGPSGGCLDENFLDTPIDYDNLIAKT